MFTNDTRENVKHSPIAAVSWAKEQNPRMGPRLKPADIRKVEI
jgi:hypothetical protein